MKRLRCPKCDEAIPFDETRYAPGSLLVFECPACHKRFKIRMPDSSRRTAADEGEEAPTYGELIVIENAFHFKQTLPLHAGDNVIGRLVKGTRANAAIKTVDPSVDTTHCIVTVTPKADGTATYSLRDATSNTGTFLHNKILGPKERASLTDGDIITIGATSLILRTPAAGDAD